MANPNVNIVNEEPVPDEIVIVKEMPILERDIWENNNEDRLSPNSVQRAIAEEIGETSSFCAKTIYEKGNEEEIEIIYINQHQNALECKKPFGNNSRPKKKNVCKKVGEGKCCVCGLVFQKKSNQIPNGNVVVKTSSLEHFNLKTNTVCDICSQHLRFSKDFPQSAPCTQRLTEEHFPDSVDLTFSSKNERKAKHSDSLSVSSLNSKHIPKCFMCNKVFKSLAILKIHVRQHTGETPYTCKICKKKFARSDNYKIHLRVHTRETPYRCDVCKKGFSYLSNLKTHKRLHTGETPFECKICNRAFVQSSSLNSHMRIHTGERPYQCQVCQKEFSRTNNLNVHMRTHTGETPFECEVCKKRFTRLDGLKIHLKSHSSETPFVCKVCEKPFNMLMKLKMHMRVHTGERPYHCDICKKQFKHLSNVKAHLRVHTGETPFSCKVCQREFKQMGHLKVHMKLHSG